MNPEESFEKLDELDIKKEATLAEEDKSRDIHRIKTLRKMESFVRFETQRLC